MDDQPDIGASSQSVAEQWECGHPEKKVVKKFDISESGSSGE